MALPSVASTADIQTLVDNIQHASKSYSPNDDPVTSASQRAAIRSAATQLLHAVTTPDEMAWKKGLAMTELVALRTALRLGIFAAMPMDSAISNSSLASKVNATPSLVERLMRVLVGTGFCDQLVTDDNDEGIDIDAEPSYKHTKFSLGFVSTAAPGPGTFYQGVYDVYLRPSIDFDTWMLDHPTPTGQYDEPASNTVNPYVDHFNPNPDKVATPWSVMPLYPETLRVFQMCLESMKEIIPPVGPFYDFSQFGTDIDVSASDDRMQLVDVGGGYGRVLTEIITAHPRLDPTRCVLQDVPSVIAMEDTNRIRALGVKTMPIDFFVSQPVKGAKAYYFRLISHDYTDQDLHKILTNTVSAMSSDSKLLLADCVLPSRVHESNISAAVLDSMLFCIGGRERSEVAFRKVLEGAGLRLVKVYRVPGRSGGVVESVKMDL